MKENRSPAVGGMEEKKMNLYKCPTCHHSWASNVKLQRFWCPKCGRYEPDMSPYIKPDPQSSVPQDGGIVELINRELPQWVWREKFKKVAQAIEAKDNALEAKIEAVRSLSRNHEGQIGDCIKHDSPWRKEVDRQRQNANACFRRENSSSLDLGIKDLERKVAVLEGWIKTIGIHSRQLACLDESELGRKVEALGSDLCRHMYPGLTPKPTEQPVAKDRDGKELIPETSVLKHTSGSRCIFLNFDAERSEEDLHVFWLSGSMEGGTGWTIRNNLTWVFDLRLSAKIGGDK